MDRQRGRYSREAAVQELNRRGLWGYVEPILTLGSAAFAEPVSGMMGLAALPWGTDAATRAINNTQEALTYQPRTVEGQDTLQAAGEFLQPVGDAFIGASEYVGDAAYNATGSPALGALGYSVPTIALEALGLKGASKLSKGRAYEMGDIGTQASNIGGKQRGIFAGVKAKGADLDAMAAAKELQKRGLSRDEIWQKTGWFEDVDGAWKWEIDDSQFRLDPSKPKDSEFGFRTAKGDVFDHEELGASYSELTGENMTVSFEPKMEVGGSYSKISASEILNAPREHYIRIKDSASPRASINDDMRRIVEKIGEWTRPDAAEKIADEYGIPLSQAKAELAEDVSQLTATLKKLRKSSGEIEFYNGSDRTAIHELQHGVQELEGFAKGGSAKGFADDYNTNLHNKNYYDQEAINARLKARQTPEYKAIQSDIEAAIELNDQESLRTLVPKRRAIEDAAAREFELEAAQLSEKIKLNPFEQYKRLAGEAEARNVETRLNFTPEQRRNTPPWQTLDVPEDELIVRK